MKTDPGVNTLKPVLARLAAGETLAESEAEAAFGIIMAGEATPAQIAGLLMAMRVRGETVAEMTGAVRAMRARMLAIEAPPGAIDIVGTGGDASGSLNISTATALVVAGCGVPVAKHGNRALSSQIRRRRCAGGARHQPRRAAGPAAGGAGRGRHGLPHGAPPPCRAAPCRRPAGRARHPHHLQPARPPGQPGPGEAPDDRRLRRRLAPPHGRDAGAPRHRGAPGSCMARGWTRWPSSGRVPGRGTEGRQPPRIHHRAGGGRAAAPRPRHPRRRAGGERRRPCTALLGGAPGAYRDCVLLNAAAALVVAGRRGTCGTARPKPRVPSTAGPPLPYWAG